ncbi:hypothetical protein Sango_0916500 [Sesamum angolense]|uniref:Uncharacterized protein n=1 Tax=Sesamum angolense TaxID=2727404 RepID=A0AAE1WYU1_9LAMI|nr:hypothetical protein Sango_0916500 [Sesamum angolense]
MASLKNGVLLKLLEDMKMEDIALDDDPKPVLLQIRSIIPVLEEGDLWPNRGFFLKVSDLSHAFYVSLTDQQNEMILGNKLKLGQYIYVEKLEKAEPAPLLKGVTPVPGRRPCEGTPVDIVPPPNLVKLLEASGVDSVVEKGVILEKKISKTQSIPRKLMRGTSARRSEVSFALKAEDFEKVNSPDECRLSSVDNDSDGDSVILSSSSAHMAKRRSWTESEIMGVKEIFDSSLVNHEIKLPPRSRSANVSPVRSAGYESSDDNSNSTTRRRASLAGSAKRLIKNSSKGRMPALKVNNVQIPNSLCSLHERKGAETGISWNSLPPNLVKFGKDVIRQRDIALSAASDALQEACASERLLSSLSTLSQIPLGEGEDLQPYVDKFFELQHDLALQIFPRLISVETTNTLKKTSPSNRSNKPKGACIIKRTGAVLISLFYWLLTKEITRVKMVNDCLDVIVNIEDSEAEAYRRVRNKIYGILLKHVERTAMVLERLNGST